jgi:hypothetical protein
LGAVPKQTIIVPKRTKVAKKTCIEIPILRTTSGGGTEKYNHSAETEKIGAETAKIQSAEKSAETGGNRSFYNQKASLRINFYRSIHCFAPNLIAE